MKIENIRTLYDQISKNGIIQQKERLTPVSSDNTKDLLNKTVEHLNINPTFTTRVK